MMEVILYDDVPLTSYLTHQPNIDGQTNQTRLDDQIEADNMETISEDEWVIIKSSNKDAYYNDLADEYFKHQLREQYSNDTNEQDFKDILEEKSHQADDKTHFNRTEDGGGGIELKPKEHISGADETIMIIGSIIIFIGAIYILNSIFKSKKRSSSGSPHSNKNHTNSQGILYKKIFLFGLFFTNISRSFTFVFDVVNRMTSNRDYYTDGGLSLSLILMDLPTLFFMSSFSFFIYYFAKLTMQVEAYRSKSLYLPALDDEDNQEYDDKRQVLLGKRGSKKNVYKRRIKNPSLIKPFFIIFNIFTYLAYIVICIYFFQQRQRNEEQESDGKQITGVLPQYYRAVSGLNGLMFLMLALAVLNYGSRLETLISKTKSSGSPTARSSEQNLTGSVRRRHQRAKSNSMTADQYMAINETSKRILHGLDLRIFLITICLSMLFFIVSVSEFLQAWALIEKSQSQWKIALFFICTEFIPSVLIAYFLSKSPRRIRGRHSMVSPSHGDRSLQNFNQSPERLTGSYGVPPQNEFEASEGVDLYEFQDEDAGSSDNDDSFGSFNPNLNRKHEQQQEYSYQGEEGRPEEQYSSGSSSYSSEDEDYQRQIIKPHLNEQRNKKNESTADEYQEFK